MSFFRIPLISIQLLNCPKEFIDCHWTCLNFLMNSLIIIRNVWFPLGIQLISHWTWMLYLRDSSFLLNMFDFLQAFIDVNRKCLISLRTSNNFHWTWLVYLRHFFSLKTFDFLQEFIDVHWKCLISLRKWFILAENVWFP